MEQDLSFKSLPDYVLLCVLKHLTSMKDVRNFFLIAKSTARLMYHKDLLCCLRNSMHSSEFSQMTFLKIEDLRTLLDQDFLGLEHHWGMQTISRQDTQKYHPLISSKTLFTSASLFTALYPRGFDFLTKECIIGLTRNDNCDIIKMVSGDGFLFGEGNESWKERWIKSGNLFDFYQYKVKELKGDDDLLVARTFDDQLLYFSKILPEFDQSLAGKSAEQLYEMTRWKRIKYFSDTTPFIRSSKGKEGHIYSFESYRGTLIITLDNGAVFFFGFPSRYSRRLLQQHSDMKEEKAGERVLIELSDPSILQPFVDDALIGTLRKEKPSQENAERFGLFGTHRIQKWFPESDAFLTSQGVLFVHINGDTETISPLCPVMFFGGKRVVDVHLHFTEASPSFIITEDRLLRMYSPVIVTSFFDWISHPLFVVTLPFAPELINSFLSTSPPLPPSLVAHHTILYQQSAAKLLPATTSSASSFVPSRQLSQHPLQIPFFSILPLQYLPNPVYFVLYDGRAIALTCSPSHRRYAKFSSSEHSQSQQKMMTSQIPFDSSSQMPISPSEQSPFFFIDITSILCSYLMHPSSSVISGDMCRSVPLFLRRLIRFHIHPDRHSVFPPSHLLQSSGSSLAVTLPTYFTSGCSFSSQSDLFVIFAENIG